MCFHSRQNPWTLPLPAGARCTVTPLETTILTIDSIRSVRSPATNSNMLQSIPAEATSPAIQSNCFSAPPLRRQFNTNVMCGRFNLLPPLS